MSLAVPPLKVRDSTACSACSGLEVKMATSPVAVLGLAATVNLSHVLCVVQCWKVTPLIVQAGSGWLVVASTTFRVTVLAVAPEGA